jgi:GNAT superfamily N-acetyltransferase
MTRPAPHPSIAAIGGSIGNLIAGHIDLAFRRLLHGPGVETERGFIRLITGAPHPFGNFVLLNDPADLDGLEHAMAPLLNCGAPSAVLFTGEVPAQTLDKMAQSGFAQVPGMPAMGVEIDKLSDTPLPGGFTFARFGASADESRRWSEAFADGYELPRIVGTCFAPCESTAADPDVHYYAILKDGSPVCTSVMFLKDGVAGIYGVATLPQERGQGLGAFVTAEPLRLARKLGYRVGVLQASEIGRPVYKRLGFEEYGAVPLFVRMPS